MDELTKQELNEKTGFTPTEDNQGNSVIDKPIGKETEEVKETPKPKEEVKTKELKVKSEEDETEEPKDEPKPKERRTVPYGKLKAEKEKRQDLEASIPDQVAKGVKEAFASLIKADKKEDLPDPIKKAAKEIAEETGFDEEGMEKLLKKTKELSADNKLPEDVQKKLDKLDKLEVEFKAQQEKQAEKEAVEKFSNEWDTFIPEIKKQYPNISDEMLKEAKEKMDEYAHSKDHSTHELDYILYKEKNIFDVLLKVAEKGNSAEKSKNLHTKEPAEDSEKMVKTEDLTPEIMKQRQERSMSEQNDDDIVFIEPEE